MRKLGQMGLLVAAALFPVFAQAAEEEKRGSSQTAQEKDESKEEKREPSVDSEHIFGFTEGSDIGEKGEKELDHSSYIFAGKPGKYVAIENVTDFRYGFDDGLRASLNIHTDYHGSYNSPGIPDRAVFAFSGLGSELDWHLLERDKATFGLTLSFLPQWRRLDDTSGVPQESFAFPLQLLADVALVPDKWFAAANLTYAPDFIHNPGRWTVSQPVEISLATSYGISSNVFIGGEIRHLTQNQTAFFSEHALFIGPSIYFKLAENTNLKLAWSAQIPDETTGRLDLVNYQRHQFRVQFAMGF